jgi:carboxymethylenebutenolidase
MDEDGADFGCIDGGIEEFGGDGLDLVVSAVESLAATPAAAAGENRFVAIAGLRERQKIGSVGDELRVDSEDGGKRGFALRRRILILEAADGGGDELADARDVSGRCGTKFKCGRWSRRESHLGSIAKRRFSAGSGWGLLSSLRGGRYTPKMRAPFAKLLVLRFTVLLFTLPFLATFAGPFAHGQDWAKQRLEQSPRHREWVQLKHGDRTVQAYVVYPEVAGKVPVVVMIHEIFGLSDWAKEMADEIASQGYIVVAPDLLSGFGPGGGGSSAFPDQEAAVKAVSGLNPEVVTADLDAAADYGKHLPSANGKVAVAGFCWGGGKSFLFATHRKDLSAAFVFYGPAPADLSGITAPVYGFYAGNDARISSTVPATTEAMKAAGKRYEPVIYDGAGHGFMRAGEDPSPATTPENKKAREAGFTRFSALLRQIDHPGTGRFVPVGEPGVKATGQQAALTADAMPASCGHEAAAAR